MSPLRKDETSCRSLNSKNSFLLIEFIQVLDLRDHTERIQLRYNPPDDSLSRDEIAIVEALSHPSREF